MTSAEAAEVPLTDSEWAGMPSTRSNYVTFSQQLPNPLLEGEGPQPPKGRRTWGSEVADGSGMQRMAAGGLWN